MKKFALALVVSGVLAAVFGVVEEQFKAIIIGIVLIFGSGVFATLHLGSRRRID
jgi:hypothetical protein